MTQPPEQRAETRAKMPGYLKPLGVLIGLLAALALLPLFKSKPHQDNPDVVGPIAADCDGALGELVIHYKTDAAPVVERPYRDFLGALGPDVTVHVLCPGPADFDDLKARTGKLQCVLNPVFVDHPMTAWARDRWFALQLSHRGGQRITLVSPQGELGAESWPERKGDEQSGEDLARALGDSVVALRSDLFFDGGDIVADSETAFVTPSVLKRNLGQSVQTREELVQRLTRLTGRRVLLMTDSPDHHACMFMMPVGNRTVIVADPRGAQRLLTPEQAAALPLPEGADFSEATCARFDAVADQCAKEGYKVVRMPLAPAPDGRTFLAGLNAILDQRNGKRTVYMPVFDGADVINQSSTKVWQDLGYEVRPVNCTSSYRLFGSLRCLVNVLRRG